MKTHLEVYDEELSSWSVVHASADASFAVRHADVSIVPQGPPTFGAAHIVRGTAEEVERHVRAVALLAVVDRAIAAHEEERLRTKPAAK